MNFYQYIFLENLSVNNDLTINVPDSVKDELDFNLLGSKSLGDNYIKNPYVDNYGLTTNVVSYNNYNYFGTTKSNEFGLFQECLYTLSYDMIGYESKVSIDYFLRYYRDEPIQTVVISNESSELGSEVKHFDVTFKVPTNITSGIITLDGSNCIYDNISLTPSTPIVMESEKPEMVISRLGKKYLDQLKGMNDITFDDMNKNNLIYKIKKISLISRNTPAFILAQLCSVELLALDYYQRNDQEQFNLLIPSDFYRIKRNLKALKFMTLKNFDSAIELYDSIDKLIKSLGYYQTAFTTLTESIPQYFGR